MSKFRKKPVVIEAMQFNGKNHREILRWAGPECGMEARFTSHVANPVVLYMTTLESPRYHDAIAVRGDWIIRGVRGEFYPCKPYIFEQTYEPVDDEQTR